jgi:hypothetical protein
MKIINLSRLGLFFGCLFFVLSACASLPWLQQSEEREMILTPTSAAVSPKMDFNKITAVAVFPLFPGGQMQMGSMGWQMGRSVDDPKFAEQIWQAFCSELTAKQSQWKIYSYKEVVETIFKNNLGRGYKNLQADFNTLLGQQMRTFMLTKESKYFLRKLSSVMKVDAFIFGSYNLAYGTKYVSGLLGPQKRQILQCLVNVALFQTNSEEIWWKASDQKTSNDKNKLVSSISKSLASYVGKGTLQRL